MAAIILSFIILLLNIRMLVSIIQLLQRHQIKFNYLPELLNIIFFVVGYLYARLWVSYHFLCTYYTILGLNFYYFILYTIPECFLIVQLLVWITVILFKPNKYLLSHTGWTVIRNFIQPRTFSTVWDLFLVSFLFFLFFSCAVFKFLPLAPILFNSYIYLSKGILELKLIILGINYLYLLNFSRLELSFSTLKFLGFNISLYLFATCLLLSSNNLFLIFLALELQNFLTYILISTYKTRATTISSIFLYLIINSILTIFFLFSLLIIYGIFKTIILTELQVLCSVLQSTLLVPELQQWLIYSLLLNWCILLFKLASAPFHFWIRDIYAGISFSLVGFFIINTKFILFFLLLKLIFIFSNPLLEPYLQLLFFISGLLSIVIGSFLTFSQTTIKTFLICSSIPHTGYLLLGLLNYTNPINLIAVSGYLFQYLVTLLLIWSILSYFLEYTPQLDISLTELNSYLKYFPGLSILLCLCLLSLAGIPPLVGFFFKYHLLVAIASTHFSLVLMILLGSLISCYYYLNIIKLILIDGTQKFSFEFFFNFIRSELQYMLVSSLFFTFVISSVVFNTIYTCNLTLILLLFF